MSDEHKAALEVGRAESRSVKKYLEALEQNRPKRGRRRTKEGIEARLAQIETDLPTTAPLQRVKLIQERMDLSRELNTSEEPIDISGLEDGFVAVAKSYSEHQGISYAAWRELGVSAAVLKRAGVTRGS